MPEKKLPVYCAVYKKLIRLYPMAFRERFGESLEQTFGDICNDLKKQGKGVTFYSIRTFAETTVGIIDENLRADHMKNILENPYMAAITGLLFCAPFLVMNAIVATQMQPLFSIIRPGPHTSTQEYILLVLVLLLMPIGAFIALRPVLQKDDVGKRKLRILNIAVASLLLGVFVLLVYGLGGDIYRCDVLGIPNCD